MIAKFQIEQVITIKGKVYVLAKHTNIDVNFFLADDSYLGPAPIEKWMDIPRAHDADGNVRTDLFAFVLKRSEDKDKLKNGETLALWDDYVEVIESFKFSDGRVIAFLKCYPGKLDGPLELSDTIDRKWMLKCEVKVMGSYNTYEKIRDEGKRNVFQYLLEPINHELKPLKNHKLKISSGNYIVSRNLFLFHEAANIAIKVKEKIKDDSDVIWAGYNKPVELRSEIDTYIYLLQRGDQNALEKLKTHFLPTCTFQEHSISNGWADDYIVLANQFDSVYAEIKRILEG